jgi:ABC-type oligopeptide transport system ATPase subunit
MNNAHNVYNPWKNILSNIKKYWMLGVSLLFVVVAIVMMVFPFIDMTYATRYLDESVEEGYMQISYNYSITGFQLAFSGVIAFVKTTNGVLIDTTQAIQIAPAVLIAFILLIAGIAMVSYTYLTEEKYSLSFFAAAFFLIAGTIFVLASPLSGRNTLVSGGQSDTYTREIYTPSIFSIIGAIVLLLAAALIVVNYFVFYVKAMDDNTNVKFKQELVDNNIILSVRHLKMFFPMGPGKKLKAVHDVSFDIKKGECFGLVGESGCGKTTTGRSVIRLHHVTSGSIYFKGYRIAAGSRWNEKEIKWSTIHTNNKIKQLKSDLNEVVSEWTNFSEEGKDELAKIKAKYDKEILDLQTKQKEWTAFQKAKIRQIKYDDSHVNRHLMSKMQMIFQDPIDSLDPRMTVEDIIQEGLKIQGFRNRAENHQKACKVLEEVGLIADYCSRYPNEFSGGQRQRIGIARAVVMNPEFMICDEPISALDVSIRAQIINLLNDLKVNHGLTLMFIAHDLSVVKYFCDRIAVMYFGEMVEMASSDELFAHPLHPYTRALLSAIPKPDPYSEKKRQRIIYRPSEAHDYSKEKPKFQEILPGHFVLANSEEMEKYRAMIKEDDILNEQKARAAEEQGTEY